MHLSEINRCVQRVVVSSRDLYSRKRWFVRIVLKKLNKFPWKAVDKFNDFCLSYCVIIYDVSFFLFFLFFGRFYDG